jgi:hypothetical protein
MAESIPKCTIIQFCPLDSIYPKSISLPSSIIVSPQEELKIYKKTILIGIDYCIQRKTLKKLRVFFLLALFKKELN